MGEESQLWDLLLLKENFFIRGSLIWNFTVEQIVNFIFNTIVRLTLPSSSPSSKRYYFEDLQLNSTQIKLSVSSAGRLPEDLQSLKSGLGLILVNLEDATIALGW